MFQTASIFLFVDTDCIKTDLAVINVRAYKSCYIDGAFAG